MNSIFTEIEKCLWNDAPDYLRSLGGEGSGEATSLFDWWYGLQ